MKRLSASSLALFAACVVPAVAHAHEPPHGLRLVWGSEAAEARPTILTNRGLIFPNEGGTSAWNLRCTDGYRTPEGARPEVMLDAQGGVVIASTLYVMHTSDRACNTTLATGLPSREEQDRDEFSLGGFASDPSKPGRTYMTTQAYKVPAKVFVSDDYARTFTELSTNAQYSVYRYLRSGPDGHMLATGRHYDPVNIKLTDLYAYSTDSGATWTDVEVDSPREPLGFLPNDGNVMFMRAELPERTIDPADHLLRSTDGGKTFEQIGGEWPTLLSFAASADGQHVWVGARFKGLFHSSDSGKTFTRVQQGMVVGASCIYHRGDTLWVCANMAPNTDGIWTSKDLGATFQKYMTFNEVTEEVACTDTEICEFAWFDWEYELLNGWSQDGGVIPRPDAGSDAGAPPVDGDASVGPDLDAGIPTTDAAPPQPSKPKSDDGCALGSGSSASWLWLALAGLWLRRRRS